MTKQCERPDDARRGTEPAAGPDTRDMQIVGDGFVFPGGGVKRYMAALQEFKRRRGPQKSRKKVAVSIRLSPEVIEHYRATGDGWQTRIDETLARVVQRQRRKAARS